MSKFSPSSNKAHDLGASDKKWGTLHVGTVSAEDATVAGDLTISGNLTVLGEATEVSLTELTVADPLIKVADGNNANAVDIGFYGQYNEGGGARYSGLAKDATDGKFKLFDNLAVEPTTVFDGSASGHLKASTFEGSLVGNADSATVLDTARDFSISGDVTASAVSFDGSSNVELVVSIDEGAVTNAMLAGSIADGKLAQDYIQTSEVDDSSIEFAGGTLNVKALGVTNAMLAGSIANDKLSNSSVSFGGVSVSLGGSDASPAFNLADATGYPTSSLVGQILDDQIAQDYIQITEVDDSSIEFAGGTLNVKALGITNAMLAGSIANDKLSNSSVSFGGVTLSLGQSDASPAFDLSDATGYPTSSLVGQILDGQIAQDYIQITEVDDSSIEWSGSAIRVKDLGITNAKLAGSIANAKLVNSSITVGDGTNSEAIALGESFSIQGTAQEVEVAYSTALNKFTVGLPNSVSVTSNLDVGGNITASGALIVGGNLTASGQITSTGANISFADNLIELGVNNTDLEDIGFYGQIGDGAGGSNGFAGVAYDISKDKFVMFKDATEPTTTISGGATYADVEVGGVTASSGNFSGSLAGKLQIQSVTAPANASSTGTAGQIAYDSNYFYVCIATNSWKRVAINDGW